MVSLKPTGNIAIPYPKKAGDPEMVEITAHFSLQVLLKWSDVLEILKSNLDGSQDSVLICAQHMSHGLPGNSVLAG